METKEAAELLNMIELSALQESLEIFRHNLFAQTDQGTKNTAREIAAILSKELDNREADAALPKLVENYNGNLQQLSVDIFHAM